MNPEAAGPVPTGTFGKREEKSRSSALTASPARPFNHPLASLAPLVITTPPVTHTSHFHRIQTSSTRESISSPLPTTNRLP